MSQSSMGNISWYPTWLLSLKCQEAEPNEAAAWCLSVDETFSYHEGKLVTQISCTMALPHPHSAQTSHLPSSKLHVSVPYNDSCLTLKLASLSSNTHLHFVSAGFPKCFACSGTEVQLYMLSQELNDSSLSRHFQISLCCQVPSQEQSVRGHPCMSEESEGNRLAHPYNWFCYVQGLEGAPKIESSVVLASNINSGRSSCVNFREQGQYV